MFEPWILPLTLRAAVRPLAARFAPAVVAVVCLGWLCPARGFAAVSPIEYQLKAGFLFNFAKFVEWPGHTLPPGAAIRVGIVAPDEVFQLLEKALRGKTAGDRPIAVQRLSAADFDGGRALPNIIYLQRDVLRPGADDFISPERLAAAAETQPVLLVGDSAGFATSGGMIGFVQRGENLRFQVNLAGAQRAGLKLSARLAALAEIVPGPKP